MSTVIEETYCDTCGTELEPGQVGLCEDCRPHKFSELSDKAKQKAREEYTSGDYPGYDWWDGVYEDAVRMAKMLGIEIDQREFMTYGGKTRHEPKIFFSGFSSQGDGASFEGSYNFAPNAVSKIKAETNDKELIRIAEALYVLHLARRLQALGEFRVNISTHSNYSHSNTINCELVMDDDSTEVIEPDLEGLEDEVTQLMRDFADWIYERLDAENDYLYSDECVDEYLNQDDMVLTPMAVYNLNSI